MSTATPQLVCPMHADETIPGTPVGDGSFAFVCSRKNGHARPGPFAWTGGPWPDDDAGGIGGLAAELRLDVELPHVVASLGPGWHEYGIVERAYALANPDDFNVLIERYGHTALAAGRYTTSSFLARVLGELSRQGSVAWHGGPATGRWSYNAGISYWSTDPETPWEQPHSWEASGADMRYVTGQTEVSS